MSRRKIQKIESGMSAIEKRDLYLRDLRIENKTIKLATIAPRSIRQITLDLPGDDIEGYLDKMNILVTLNVPYELSRLILGELSRIDAK